jgi:hypothetical protein
VRKKSWEVIEKVEKELFSSFVTEKWRRGGLSREGEKERPVMSRHSHL